MAVTTWRFVDQPVASPTVLLDMNDGNTWKTLGSSEFFHLPSPPLRRSIASNAMSDGGTLTGSAYDLRTLEFTLELTASTEAGREGQMDALKRELSKPANLLMYQSALSANPVFFRTLRSDEYDLDSEFIPGRAWRVKCAVLAEPFAIGLRHDIVSGLVVNNDPAAATNPTWFDITGVRGDSPSPAFARVALGAGAAPTFYWAQRTGGTGLTVVAQAEAGTMGTDTTVQSNDTAMSGAGGNFVRCSFANPGMFNRVIVGFTPGADPAALRGRFRVLVKIRMSASGSNFSMRFFQNTGMTNAVSGQIVSLDSAAVISTVDLGVVEFPGPGAVPTTIGYSGLPAGYTPQTLGIAAARNSGTATMDIDYVYLLPADERAAQFRRMNWVAGSYIVLDGPQELAYGMSAGTTPFGGTRTIDNGGGLTSYFGGWPMLAPGLTNRWYALIGGQGALATSTWDVSYWPRWREVATS